MEIKIDTVGGQIVLVPIPKEAHGFTVYKYDNVYFHYNYWINKSTQVGSLFFYNFFGGKKKYPKDMEVISTLSNITDELVANYVDGNGLGCYDNYKGIKDNKYTLENATESFKALLQSKGVDLAEEWMILKVINKTKNHE